METPTRPANKSNQRRQIHLGGHFSFSYQEEKWCNGLGIIEVTFPLVVRIMAAPARGPIPMYSVHKVPELSNTPDVSIL